MELVKSMKPFILAGQYGLSFERSGRADAAVPFLFRFVDGMLPSSEELADYVAPLTKEHGRGAHWSVYTRRWHDPYQGRKSLGLVEFCEPFETVELWFDPAPNDQLPLVWLLALLSSYPQIVAKLKMRLVDFDLLEELPSSTTGLGATEMRMLELIARGYERTSALSHLRSLSQRRIFNEWELGLLLCGLAHGPTPAVAGLDDDLRTIAKENYRDRDAAYKRSRLSLTEFGKAIVAHKEDFSRHNPIDRWWGGTHLTNDNLWRWNPALVAP